MQDFVLLERFMECSYIIILCLYTLSNQLLHLSLPPPPHTHSPFPPTFPSTHTHTHTGITVNSCSLTLLSTGSQEFVQVQALFQRTWARAKGACPGITCMFLIRNIQLEARWKRYKTSLPIQAVEQHYHGTKLTCDIANQQKTCTDSNCGVCGISLMGMDRRCIRQNINFQRFGHGFYLAPNSSKCHDYTQGVHIHRAILQCDILPGKKHMLTRGDHQLTGPPPGCHSVYGQAGGELNYEEVVVYNPDCVMPRYIIVYQRDGVHKIAK